MSMSAADLPKAQARNLTKLKALVMDRAPHGRYLALLLAAPVDRIDHVDVPPDVSRRVAEALRDDVFWCRRLAARHGELVSHFPDAYHRLRDENARLAAARREQACKRGPASLASLLTIGK